MGEVYRARDLKLGRDVALKILPAAFGQDPERLVRFQREAHLLASLSHPNIATIHGFEEAGPALVLELVEGPTLADRIAADPMPMREALAIARQIADALDAAHEQGIIHRDLKPANIKVREDGAVKVLDFGLAKAMSQAASGVSPSGGAPGSQDATPTITSPAMTQQGIVLGTAAYMSPEQARGRQVDKRTDIWAFGVVLYEMLSGRTLFAGDTVTDVLASVVTRDPDWSVLPPATPVSIQRLLRRCLEKDQKRRVRDAADVRLEIEDTLAAPSDSVRGMTLASAPVRSRWWPAAIIAAVIAGAAIGLMVGRPSTTAGNRVRTVALVTPPGSTQVSLSPNGEWMAASTLDGPLYIRRIDDPDWRELRGVSADGIGVFWSADSRHIGFASGTSLKRIDLVGSRAQTICDPCLAPTTFRGASWNQRGEILFSAAWADLSGGLKKVADTGGAVVTVTTMDRARGESSHRYPLFLPDGRSFLYTVRRSSSGDHEIMWASLDGGSPRRVISGFSAMAYAQGHLLLVRDETLIAQAVDAATGQPSGDPITIATHVRHNAAIGTAYFSVTADGTLVYARAPDSEGLRWTDRSGVALRQLTTARSAGVARVSRDGARVLASVADLEKGSTDIYVIAAETGARTRLTSHPNWEEFPVWSPDGRRVAYRAVKDRAGLYLQNTDGGDEQFLIDEPGPDHRLDPADWSLDGTLLVNRWTSETSDDLVVVSTDGSPVIRPWLATKASERRGRFSPDGRFVAYTSDESGSDEIHVRAFANPSVMRRVTTSGGELPVWSRDGRELFYIDREGWLVAVPIRTDPTLQSGEPVRLFKKARGEFSPAFDVDGRGRFLIFSVDSSMESSRYNIFNMVLNWPLLLKPNR